MVISFLQASECLWNHNIPSYHQQSQNKDLYDLLSKELDDKYDSLEIHKKKKLEKKFKQEHSKALMKSSVVGSDEIYRPTFPFYNHCCFSLVFVEQMRQWTQWRNPLIQNQEKSQSEKSKKIDRTENWS